MIIEAVGNSVINAGVLLAPNITNPIFPNKTDILPIFKAILKAIAAISIAIIAANIPKASPPIDRIIGIHNKNKKQIKASFITPRILIEKFLEKNFLDVLLVSLIFELDE